MQKEINNFLRNLLLLFLFSNVANSFAQDMALELPASKESCTAKKKDSTEIEKANGRFLASLASLDKQLKELKHLIEAINAAPNKNSTGSEDSLMTRFRVFEDSIVKKDERINDLYNKLETSTSLLKEEKKNASQQKTNDEMKLNKSLTDIYTAMMKESDFGNLETTIENLKSDVSTFNMQSKLLEACMALLDEGTLSSKYKTYLTLKTALTDTKIDELKYKKQAQTQKILQTRFGKFDALATEFKELVTDMEGIIIVESRTSVLNNYSMKSGIEQYKYLKDNFKKAEQKNYKCPW